uniref:Ig-like domain-containing protein n=2 Tax=Clastoptera arizonana TaxID=38151 RepID=A0A1B6DEL1_9HEMI
MSMKELVCLKLNQVRIDQHTVRGNNTVLQCNYDLQGETLYSVKWYKDGNEFFRFLPRDNPPAQIFTLPGVIVDMDASNSTQVTLKTLTLASSGRYRCEVSAEAPSFQTVSDHGDMVTVMLPKEGPKISGGRPRYQVGDTVRVNCTSGQSKPGAQLMWFINGGQANNTFLRGPTVQYIGREGLEETTLGLEFRVESKHFRKGDLKLKCLATIATVYWNSNEESVEGEKPQRSPAMEVKDTVSRQDKSRADRVLVTGGSGNVRQAALLVLVTLFLSQLQFILNASTSR